MGEAQGGAAASVFRSLCARRFFRRTVFAIVVGLVAWAHLYGLADEGIDDVDSAALYRMLTHRLPSHDLSYFGGYTDGVAMPAYLWGRYSYLLTLWAESFVFNPTVYRVYLQNALLGVLAAALLYRTGNRHIRAGTGPFACVAFGLGSLPLFYTRHMKDFAFTLLFLALGMHLLCSAWKRRNRSRFLFAGLALGVAATANYAALPSVAVVLAVAAVVALRDLLRHDRPAKELAGQHTWLAGGLLLVVLAVESFEPVAAYYFPFWEIPPTWGYLKGMMAHKASAAPHAGSYLHAMGLPFYLELFWREGIALALPAVAGLILAIARREYRTRQTMLFMAVLAVPIGLYSYGDSVASLARNALPSYLGFAIAAAIGYRELSAGTAHLAKMAIPKLPPAYTRSIVQGILLAAAVSFALPGARASMAPRSAAERIHRAIGVDRACFTAPDEFAYHWNWYYFRDPQLACRSWAEVADSFLNKRAEYLVTLPERYTRWKDSPLAGWTGPALLEVNDRFDFAIGGPAKAYDLHEPSMLAQLGLGTATVLWSSRSMNIEESWREDIRQELRDPHACGDVSIPGDGIFEIRGRTMMNAPGSLLLLAVGTQEAPARYRLEVIPPRLPNKYLDERRPWTSIQTCFGVSGLEEVRIALVYILPDSPAALWSPIEDFTVTHYAGDCALAEPRNVIGPQIDRSAEHDELLTRLSQTYPSEIFNGDAPWSRWGPQSAERVDASQEGVLTIQNLGHTVLQPAGAMWTFGPGAYRPGAVYRVTFRGRTNRMQEGEVDLVFAGGEKESALNVKRLGFWMPWWRSYSFDFVAPPDGKQPFSLLFREARAPRRFGRIDIGDISVREVTEGPVDMQGPDDEVDFRQMQ